MSLVLVGCASEEGELSTPSESAESTQDAESETEEDRLTTEEFKDLLAPTFMYGGEDDAEYTDGWDYSDCIEIEKTPRKLTDAGCEYALESHFFSESEKLQLTVLLAAPSQPNPSQAESLQDAIDGEYRLHEDGIIDDADAEQAESELAPADNFAGVVVVSSANVDAGDLNRYAKSARNYIRDVLNPEFDPDD